MKRKIDIQRGTTTFISPIGREWRREGVYHLNCRWGQRSEIVGICGRDMEIAETSDRKGTGNLVQQAL